MFSFITIGFDETFPIFADSSKSYGRHLPIFCLEFGVVSMLVFKPMEDSSIRYRVLKTFHSHSILLLENICILCFSMIP